MLVAPIKLTKKSFFSLDRVRVKLASFTLFLVFMLSWAKLTTSNFLKSMQINVFSKIPHYSFTHCTDLIAKQIWGANYQKRLPPTLLHLHEYSAQRHRHNVKYYGFVQSMFIDDCFHLLRRLVLLSLTGSACSNHRLNQQWICWCAHTDSEWKKQSTTAAIGTIYSISYFSLGFSCIKKARFWQKSNLWQS